MDEPIAAGSAAELELLHEQVSQLCDLYPALALSFPGFSADYDCSDVVNNLRQLSQGYRTKILRPLKASLAKTVAKSVTNSLSRHLVACRPHRHPDLVEAVFEEAQQLCSMPCAAPELQCAVGRALVQTLVIITAFMESSVIESNGCEFGDNSTSPYHECSPRHSPSPSMPIEPNSDAVSARQMRIRGRAKSDLSRMIFEAEWEMGTSPVGEEPLGILSPEEQYKAENQESCLEEIHRAFLFHTKGSVAVFVRNWKAQLASPHSPDFLGFELSCASVGF